MKLHELVEELEMPMLLEPPPRRVGATQPKDDTTWPRAFRWTNESITVLNALDAFQDRKIMLLDGELYEMPIPNPSTTCA